MRCIPSFHVARAENAIICRTVIGFERKQALGRGTDSTDIDQAALAEVSSSTGARIVAPDEIYDVEADIFSPNALGAIINEQTLERFRVKAIAGGANNQLIVPEMGELLRRRGILYAPDYVINGGGIINVCAEISGTYSRDWVDAKVRALMVTLGEVLDSALETGEPTNLVADRIARKRIGRAD